MLRIYHVVKNRVKNRGLQSRLCGRRAFKILQAFPIGYIDTCVIAQRGRCGVYEAARCGRATPPLERSKASTIGLATKIDEYVPIKNPTNNANANP